MDDKQVQYIPFHAINEFMLNDFRLHVIQVVFTGLNHLSGERRSAINSIIKRHIKVPGFRNSLQAPAGIKARSAITTFENRPELVAQVIQAWSELNPDLRQKVFEFLTAKDWQLLPADADRTRLPGFMVEWPEGQTYDVLDQDFAQMFPDYSGEVNDLRLMIVWLANRLPYDMYDEDDEGED